jgi:hypothetical protein
MPLNKPDRQPAGESKGSLQAISKRRGLFAVLLASSISMFGMAVEGCANGIRTANQSPNIAAKASNEGRGEWWFMDEAQKESARALMSLPCDRIEEVVRKSRAIEIPLIPQLLQAARGVQTALASNDLNAIREKSASFYTLAIRGEGESQQKFIELAEDPSAAMELMMFQDYFIPALDHARRLSLVRD